MCSRSQWRFETGRKSSVRARIFWLLSQVFNTSQQSLARSSEYGVLSTSSVVNWWFILSLLRQLFSLGSCYLTSLGYKVWVPKLNIVTLEQTCQLRTNPENLTSSWQWTCGINYLTQLMSHQSWSDEFSDVVYIGSIHQKCLFTMFFDEVEPRIYEFLITVGVLLIATLLILTFFISTAIDFAVRRCFKVSRTSLAVLDLSLRKFWVKADCSQIDPMQLSLALRDWHASDFHVANVEKDFHLTQAKYNCISTLLWDNVTEKHFSSRTLYCF